MLKFFSTYNSRFLQALRNPSGNPGFHISISRFHRPNETLISNPAIKFILDEIESSQLVADNQFVGPDSKSFENKSSLDLPELQISHPWSEWIALMELLLKGGYFERIGNPFQNSGIGAGGSNQIRTACLDFARNRSDLIRFLSRKDIQVIAGCGCPCIDRKVVNSGKRLRAHVGIEEGNVCSSCSLRGNCERAYVKALKDECGRTVDVMRLVLTYGLNPMADTVENKPCLNTKVKESVRALLKELVEYSLKVSHYDTCKDKHSKVPSSLEGSKTPHLDQTRVPMKQGDWMCPSCNFLNFARNIKCLRCDGLFQDRLKKLNEDQDQLPLKKGDWICDKCNYLNFAKNTRCLQCKEKPPKRELYPGEWECESCNYINFRRNMVCLNCDHKRPKACASGNPQNHDDSNCHSQNETLERKQKGYKVDGEWKFVEHESNDHNNKLDLQNNFTGFVDFPIIGGKSDLSIDKQKQELWKMQMTKGRSTRDAPKNNDKIRPPSSQKGLRLFESADDEELDEWFGQGKSPGG